MGVSDKQKFLGGLSIDEKNTFTKIYDRSLRSEKFNGAMFSDFLSMEELSRLGERKKYLPDAETSLWGGYEDAERKIAGFNAEENEFPIKYIEVKVKASGLSHRDYLGSVMGLGIERCKIGDIIVSESGAVIVAHSDVGEYIVNTLLCVGRANAQVKEIQREELSLNPKKFSDVSGTVASLRLDSITAMVMGKGRNAACETIKAGRVFVNGLSALKADMKINDKDLITVRGFGKAEVEVKGRSKKDRIFVTLKKYV